MGKPSAKKKPQPLLDLHGFTTDEVYDALESFLGKHTAKTQVFVMHGKGSGKIKAKVIEYLKAAKYPYNVYRDANGNPNDGILVVYME